MSVLRTAASALLAASQVAATGVLLPLYVYPSAEYNDGAKNWAPAVNAAIATPNISWLMVINPGDGPGASTLPGNNDVNYVSGLTQLNAQTNVQTIGYVHTLYGSADMDELQANITTWVGWGSADNNGGSSATAVSGIFFDESSTDDFDYLSEAITFARTAFGAQQITTVCNFGSAVLDVEFYNICDVVIVFESALNDPGVPVYESTETIEANTPDAGYYAQAAVIVHDFVGTSAEGETADTTLLRTYVQEASGIETGWVYFCSGGYDSITTGPATVEALAAAF
ncbi:Spherulation-specific family 4-domain-containing protein [Xylaria arbuscula]|nr:Spherulation-specific family 4-domain-containing protein [Xylaria arbuscula]